jgi:hypothetical protein
LAYHNTLQTVAQMRKAQVEYFKNRTQENLIAAKKLENAIDIRLGYLGIKAE